MTLPGAPRGDSPFHEGELAIQERTGVRERMDGPGRRMLRAELTEEQRDLFAELPFVVAGTRDAQGRIWATLLAGEPGFVRSPEPGLLHVCALPGADDPARVALGEPVGLLGIQLPTRRRNRVNGVVTSVDAAGFTVRVDQAFGNCPKYIHPRTERVSPREERLRRPPSGRALGPRLPDEALGRVRRADTFFIASGVPAAAEADHDRRRGLDVSHRGGPAGFVTAGGDEETVLEIPDFPGNRMFNTLGNLLVAPAAGLVFPDFTDGTLLSLTGEAEIDWDVPRELAAHGIERTLRFRVRGGVLRSHVLPFCFE